MQLKGKGAGGSSSNCMYSPWAMNQSYALWSENNSMSPQKNADSPNCSAWPAGMTGSRQVRKVSAWTLSMSGMRWMLSPCGGNSLLLSCMVMGHSLVRMAANAFMRVRELLSGLRWRCWLVNARALHALVAVATGGMQWMGDEEEEVAVGFSVDGPVWILLVMSSSSLSSSLSAS